MNFPSLNASKLLITGLLLVSAPPLLAKPPGSCSPWPECKDGSGDDSGGDSGQVSVSATFRNGDTDNMLGDGSAYPGSIDKARFSLDTEGRSLTLDFSWCISGPCDGPSGVLDLNDVVWMAVRGSRGDNLLTDELLTDVELRIRFNHGGSLWFLDFNPSLSTCDVGGATSITMVRVDADTWAFGNDLGVACLQEEVRVGRGNKTEYRFRGNYEMPFSVDAVRVAQ